MLTLAAAVLGAVILLVGLLIGHRLGAGLQLVSRREREDVQAGPVPIEPEELEPDEDEDEDALEDPDKDLPGY